MDNYTIAESFILPSHGLVYDVPINEEIKLRSMTVKDEMRRTAPNTTGALYKNMADIIDSCLIEKPGISSYDMCIGDYQFLMHKLRIVTHGSEYKVEGRCPICGEFFPVVVNLDDLELFELKDFDKNEYLKVKLPVSGHEIDLNVTTPRILDNIEKDVRRVVKNLRKNNEAVVESDWHLLYQLIYAIKLVDGQALNVAQKETFCNNLVGKDYMTVLNAVNKLDYKIGLGDEFEVVCKECGNPIKFPFRITDEFFRPTTISKG